VVPRLCDTLRNESVKPCQKKIDKGKNTPSLGIVWKMQFEEQMSDELAEVCEKKYGRFMLRKRGIVQSFWSKLVNYTEVVTRKMRENAEKCDHAGIRWENVRKFGPHNLPPPTPLPGRMR